MIKQILRMLNKENINNIKIKKGFEEHKPKIEKMTSKLVFYTQTGKFKDEIVLDNNNYLIDGYTTYLLAKTLNKKYIRVKRENI